VLWGRPLIRFLQHKGVGKQIRIEQPGHHQLKTGTPTMGGVLFVVPVLVIIGLLNIVNLLGMDAIGQSTLLLFFCLGSHAIFQFSGKQWQRHPSGEWLDIGSC